MKMVKDVTPDTREIQIVPVLTEDQIKRDMTIERLNTVLGLLHEINDCPFESIRERHIKNFAFQSKELRSELMELEKNL